MMEVLDYNGSGRWSIEGIQAKYAEYCQHLSQPPATELAPHEHVNGDIKRVYPLMDRVIDDIEAADGACIAIGLDFIEEDQHFVFGKILKSNTARSLRRADLNETQKERVRKRVVAMLLAGKVPHEYKEYAKLLRKVGLGDWWPRIDSTVDKSNPYVMKYYRYFRRHA